MVLSVFCGCRTVSINSAQSIPVPAGLSSQDVKLAILSAVYPEQAPQKMTVAEKMTDNALKAAFPFGYSKVNRSGRWFVEELKSGSVMVGYTEDEYYLRVEYLIEDSKIVPRIDGSRNLKQTEQSIHKTVFEWLGDLDVQIRQNMGRVSALKAAQN